MGSTAKAVILAVMLVTLMVVGYWVFSTPSPSAGTVSTSTSLPTSTPPSTSGEQTPLAATTPTSAPVGAATSADCGTVDATELKVGAFSQNAEQFLACVNNALETCIPATAAMTVNGRSISFDIEQYDGGCALKFALPQSGGNFNLVCPFSNSALQPFFSAVENATSIAPTAAERDSLKGLTFVNTILGLAGVQMVKTAPTSTTASFSFSLPYTSSTISCLGTNPSSQPTVFHISAEDKTTGIVYSDLTISIPQGAVSKTTNVTVNSLAATGYDKFLGGFYVLHPDGVKLLMPANVSITYNDAAVYLYKKRFPAFTENNLTLAYYDNPLNKYVPLQSTFNPATRTVSANISQLYGGGVMIFPQSFFNGTH